MLGKYYYLLHLSRNWQMKNWSGRNLSSDWVLVCGHSHWAELNKKNRYINSGFINYGLAQYLKITDGEMELIEEKY